MIINGVMVHATALDHLITDKTHSLTVTRDTVWKPLSGKWTENGNVKTFGEVRIVNTWKMQQIRRQRYTMVFV